MAQVFSNNGTSTLSSSISAGDVTIFIQPGHGGRYPAVAAPDFAYATLENASGTIEIVKITAHAANATSFTVQRAQQGTTAAAFSIGDLFELRITAEEMNAVANKASRIGDTYTGTHDFTGASAVNLPATATAPTAAPGTATTQLATTAFVAAQVLSATLPGQTGNNGKFLKTDGSAASWQSVDWTDVTSKPSTLVADASITTSMFNPAAKAPSATTADSATVAGNVSGTVGVANGGTGATSVATAQANLQVPSITTVQNSAPMLIGSIAGTNTITGTLTPAIASYTAGQTFRFVAAGANTGAVTININGLGAKAITKNGATPLAAGDIASGALVQISYDGTQFQLVAGAASGGATGSGGDQVFYENDTVVNNSHTINRNSHTVGPLTIASGKTLTVATGKRLVVL